MIVTSLAEAIEAQRGGADRLELTRSLPVGGLTPSFDLVQNVLRSATIPVRVMLRSTEDFAAGSRERFNALCDQARALASLKIDGLVVGFANHEGIDLASLHQLISVVPDCKITFHRAFDAAGDRLNALRQLGQFQQVDRVLTMGDAGTPEERRRSLVLLQQSAGSRITILAGGGLDASLLAYLSKEDGLTEFHVGRAARSPAENFGMVRRTRVAALKSILT